MRIRILALRFVLGIIVLNGIFSSCQISHDEAMTVEEYSETLNLDDSPLFTIDKGLVIFNSIDNFRALAEDNLKQEQVKHQISMNHNFVPAKAALYQGLNLSVIPEEEDDFLGNVANSNGMLVIGDFLFKLDLADEIVTAVVYKGIESIELLLNPLKNGKSVMVFSTDDNVLDLLEAGYTNSPNIESAAILCGGGCSSFNNLNRILYLSTNDYIESESNYIKAGIYFELSHYLFSFYMSTPSGTDSNAGVSPPAPQTSYQERFRPNCRNSSIINKNASNLEMKFKNRSNGDFFVGSSIYKYKDSLYKSTRGLREISFTPTYFTRGVFLTGRTISCT